MLNFRTLASFGFLIASVRLVVPQCYVEFVNAVQGLVPNVDWPSDIYQYNVELLHNVDPELKKRCTERFRIDLRQAKRDLEPREFEKYKPICAVKVLHKECTEYFYDVLFNPLQEINSLKPHLYIHWQFESMFKQGNIIQFFAYMYRPSIDIKEMEAEINLLTTKYKNLDLSKDAAKLWVILYQYDWGIFGDHYPGEILKNQLKRPGPYETIGDRFNDFIKLVEEAYSKPWPQEVYSKTWPEEPFKYPIGDLDKVEHYFKIWCLEEFEKKVDWAPLKRCKERNVLQTAAYLTLDNVCKDTIKFYGNTLENSVGRLKSILNQKNIIKFLVQKNNPGMSKKTMEAEIEWLMQEKKLTNDEAELWIILDKYYNPIINQHYPRWKGIFFKNKIKKIIDRFNS